MGWVMLFWVFVIVGVPTVLWFLLSEPGRSSRLPDAERKGGDGQ
jgi:predicted MFS family arabinose efflux permease